MLGFSAECFKIVRNMTLLGYGWSSKLKILDLLTTNVWNTNTSLYTNNVARERCASNEIHQESIVEVGFTAQTRRSLNK